MAVDHQPASALPASQRVICWVDMDSFFVQVHRRWSPDLMGIPIAIQQHQVYITLLVY